MCGEIPVQPLTFVLFPNHPSRACAVDTTKRRSRYHKRCDNHYICATCLWKPLRMSELSSFATWFSPPLTPALQRKALPLFMGLAFHILVLIISVCLDRYWPEFSIVVTLIFCLQYVLKIEGRGINYCREVNSFAIVLQQNRLSVWSWCSIEFGLRFKSSVKEWEDVSDAMYDKFD
ncbi:unnamed protein product [Sphenostylis stenocarpa]|uniref:Uncharacterized protein n=1 Tax=Sphenostylis stenocarpa TaxID=92480 RepID=A0AA86SGT2_9FABA|nr:unnamed protein product [Sphenostylis stenocarpa]